MWPKRDLIDLLGIEHPILQAPMGGESTPAMASAVSNAGGLGGLGCTFMPMDELREKAETIRSGTNRPFNLNFFAHPEPQADLDVDEATRSRVQPFYDELGLGEAPQRGAPPCQSFNEEKLAVVLELRPAVVSFHFGLPPQRLVRALQDAGSLILCSATTVAEACQLESDGVDAIIAQGWEAGGHRGTFHFSQEDFGVGTMALVPQVADAVSVPVIAAGGIGDGRGIAAAFALGASGVQMGTAFLACPEANVTNAYRAQLREAKDDETRLTPAFSGRPARAKNNRYIQAMAGERRPLPDFPTMYSFSDPLRAAGANAPGPDGENDFDFLLWGQGAPLSREMPAADLMEKLVAEAQAILKP